MVEGLGKDSRVDKGVSWLPLYHDMVIGFVIGPLSTDIPVVFIPYGELRPRLPASGSTRSTRHRGTIDDAPQLRLRADDQAL